MKREGFGSKIGIIAAAAGSAVGLGNICRFPCELGENGGGAFLLVYLIIVLCLGVPVMLSEFVIGRRAQKNPIGAFKVLGSNKRWSIIGFLGVLSCIVVMSFYSTVAGWTLEYIIKAVGNQFHGKDIETIEREFELFHNIGWKNVFWQGIFILITALVVFRGVSKGIERSSKILMPILIAILLVLAVRSLMLPNAGDGLSFLLKPDFSKITDKVILNALGQAFFSLSMGTGVLITYGSYIKKSDNLVTTALSVTLFDTLVAVLAGLVIFPAAFSFGIRPTAGMGLVFNTLPLIFNQMTGGYFFCIIFFVLLAVATLTSTISLMEVIVASLIEELKLSRGVAVLLGSLACVALGVFASFSLKSDSPLHIAGMSMFDFLDFMSSKVLLPIGALLVVIYVGWVMGKKTFCQEITNEGMLKLAVKNYIFFIIKYLAPFVIAIIFVKGLFF